MSEMERLQKNSDRTLDMVGASRNSLQPSREQWANVFGPSAYDIKEDENRNRKRGRVHIPDVLLGPSQFLTDRVDDPPSRDLRGTASDRSRGGFEGAPPAPLTEASKHRDPATPSAKRRSSRAARRTSAAASADLGNRASRRAADRAACAWRLAALSATRFATRSISSPG